MKTTRAMKELTIKYHPRCVDCIHFKSNGKYESFCVFMEEGVDSNWYCANLVLKEEE